MPKNWRPSLKQLSLYDELLKRQNITRKRLLKRRRIAEEESSISGRGLPTLVIPKKARRYRDFTRYRFDSYEDYRRKMAELRALYGGKGSPLKQFYKSSYKENILNMIHEWIVNKIHFDEEFGDPYRAGMKKPYYYSDIQIASVGKKDGRILELYNYLKSLDIDKFMAMYDLNVMPDLHTIYDDITTQGQFSEIDNFLYDFTRLKSEIVKTGAYKKLIENSKYSIESRPDYISSYEESTKNRSEKRLDEIRSKRFI